MPQATDRADSAMRYFSLPHLEHHLSCCRRTKSINASMCQSANERPIDRGHGWDPRCRSSLPHQRFDVHLGKLDVSLSHYPWVSYYDLPTYW